MFYLGTHEPHWLSVPGEPLFISAIRLRKRAPLSAARRDWALDSGGFTELNKHGRWGVGPEQYAGEVREWQRRYGRLQWAAIQDWMCEPFVLDKTGLTIQEHQRRTVQSWHDLNRIAPDLPWVPVLQGWDLQDYLDHMRMYREAGVNLRAFPVVGLGSVCRRQGTVAAESIVGTLSRLGLNLHLFGFKTLGLRKCAHLCASADSLAWSFRARRAWQHDQVRLCGGEHKGGCANCRAWAEQWRGRLLRSIERRPCLFAECF